MNRQVRAIFLGLDGDLVAQEHLLALEEADLGLGMVDLSQVVGHLSGFILSKVLAADLTELGQEVQGASGHPIVLEAQVMGGFDDSVGDDDLGAQAVALDHLEEVGHAVGAVHARGGQGGATRQRHAEGRDDLDDQGFVAGAVFDGQLVLGPFRAMTDEDVAVLVEAADAGILVPLSIEERRVEGRSCFDDLLQRRLRFCSRLPAKERLEDEFGRRGRGRMLHLGRRVART